MNQTEIIELLRGVIHPEQGKDIVSLGMVHGVQVERDAQGGAAGIRLTLRPTKPHDPMIGSVRRAVEGVIRQATGIVPQVEVEATAQSQPQQKPEERLRAQSRVGRAKQTIAIASGKGGVGKSTVAANLGVALAEMGFRVGILDADIYGPSMPKMFGLEGYQPQLVEGEYLQPARAYGVEVMSIGFFIGPQDALVWRGPMATSALRQLLHQTDWGNPGGELDYLLIDLPPGTGDLHLTLIGELQLTGAVIVSTPQEVALADVTRGIAMFRAEQVQVPILGIVENMAWFTPRELPDNKYRIFGPSGSIEEGGRVAQMAQQKGIAFLGSVPLVQGIAQGADSGRPSPSEEFRAIAKLLVNSVSP